MTPTERRIASRIIHRALAAGFTVAVHDGEHYALERSTDAAAILAAMASTDEDNLIIRRADGSRVGFIWLIYGNGGDGEDLIADHTANAAIEALVS